MNNYPHFTSKQQHAINHSLKKAIIMERVYWTISAFCILAFAALISGCGGSSQDDQQDLQREAQERCTELVGNAVGTPCVITDPAAYLAMYGPPVNNGQ